MAKTRLKLRRASDIEATEGPRCPSCGTLMPYYGGTAGYIHCEWKLLYRAGCWFENGKHVRDDRIEGKRGLLTDISEQSRSQQRKEKKHEEGEEPRV